MKVEPRVVLLLALSAMLAISCEDEPAAVDPKVQVEGTYTAIIKEYILKHPDTLVYTGDAYESDLLVVKTATGFDTFDEDNELYFKAKDIVEASNGFTFSIAEDKSLGLTTGYAGFNIAGKKYQGVYRADEKKITAYVMFVDEDEEYPIVEEIVAVEKK